MCEFKSGIIFKNRVVLAPLGNESHSNLLESLEVEDNEFNASKKFVRAELIPPEKYIITSDISKWSNRVDQTLSQIGIVTIREDMNRNLEIMLRVLWIKTLRRNLDIIGQTFKWMERCTTLCMELLRI